MRKENEAEPEIEQPSKRFFRGSHEKVPHAIFDKDGNEVGLTRKGSYKACHKNFGRKTGIGVKYLDLYGYKILPVGDQ